METRLSNFSRLLLGGGKSVAAPTRTASRFLGTTGTSRPAQAAQPAPVASNAGPSRFAHLNGGDLTGWRAAREAVAAGTTPPPGAERPAIEVAKHAVRTGDVQGDIHLQAANRAKMAEARAMVARLFRPAR